jgi:acyl carrier protein
MRICTSLPVPTGRGDAAPALLLLIAGLWLGAPAAAEHRDRGYAIYAERDRQDTGFVGQTVHMRMQLHSPGGATASRELQIEVQEGKPSEGDKVLLIFHAPRDIAGTALLTHERIPVNPGSRYSRQQTRVDAATRQVLEARLYDRKGRHIKTFEASRWKQYQGRYWRPHKVVMTHLPSGRSTEMIADDYRSGTLSSMDVPYMLALIEEEFDVEVDETLLAIELNNLAAIAAYIAQRRLGNAA